MQTVKVEYELAANREKKWVATVLGDTVEDAVSFIQKIVGQEVIITSIETLYKVNAISDAIIDKILKIYNNLDKTEVVTTKESKPEEIRQEIDVDQLTELRKRGRKPGGMLGKKD